MTSASESLNTPIPGIVTALRILGFVAIALSTLCLLLTFLLESEIYRAFCLGAFFTGLVGIVMLFGFAKVIELLGEIRDQGNRHAGTPDTAPRAPAAGSDPGA